MILVFIFSIQMNAQKVTVDFDQDADFSQYKSFTFLGWQKDSDQLMNDLDKERMRKAFENETSSREMIKGGDDSDLAIVFYLVLEHRTSTTAYTNSMVAEAMVDMVVVAGAGDTVMLILLIVRMII